MFGWQEMEKVDDDVFISIVVVAFLLVVLEKLLIKSSCQ